MAENDLFVLGMPCHVEGRTLSTSIRNAETFRPHPLIMVRPAALVDGSSMTIVVNRSPCSACR